MSTQERFDEQVIVRKDNNYFGYSSKKEVLL